MPDAVMQSPWRPAYPWQDTIFSYHGWLDAPRLKIEPAHLAGAAMIISGSKTRDALDERMAAIYGVKPPARPRREAGAGIELIWAGPDRWLARSPNPRLSFDLAANFEGFAAVSDQSASRAVIRISGADARNALAKGCPLDLHPRVFKPGDAALTAIAHMGVHLWQIDETPSYEIAVSRSMAASFLSWLASAG